MTQNQIEVFKSLYKDVFDDEGNKKDCSQDKCFSLIWIAQILGDPRTDYGNSVNGYLNIENIQNLYKNLETISPDTRRSL